METPPNPDAARPLPALRRALEALPIENDGKPMFVLLDREGLTKDAVALSPSGMIMASLLNGQRTVSDIQGLFAKLTGTLLQATEVSRIVGQLENLGFLETPGVDAKRRKMFEDFLASPVRKPVHQGTGYPENTLELAAFLGGFFRDPKGPGEPLPDGPTHPAPPIGLIAPHIDFRRGGPAYAWAYRALAQCPPPDVVVALGVAHVSPNSPWSMTKKAYTAPYGPMEMDLGLYEDIKSSLWYDPLDDQWVHYGEHSLEFQAVWLKFLWKDKAPPWVPILCSSFERFCPDKPPSAVATVEEAIRKIGEKLVARKNAGQKIMVLAGVDLAHVGPRFGDDVELGPELEKRIESEDRKSLEHAMNLDADNFYLSVVADGHWRKVCGLSALYTSLRWIKALCGGESGKGSLLTYGQAPDPMGGIVSFAGGIFR